MRKSSRFALHELYVQLDDPALGQATLLHFEQGIHEVFGNQGNVLRDGRQSRGNGLCKNRIVESHDLEVIGNGNILRAENLK